MLPSIEARIAAESSVKPLQVAAAVTLLDEGATVPFIARYRKEVTSMPAAKRHSLQPRACPTRGAVSKQLLDEAICLGRALVDEH